MSGLDILLRIYTWMVATWVVIATLFGHTYIVIDLIAGAALIFLFVGVVSHNIENSDKR